MSREKDGYRENLRLLGEQFPGTGMLNVTEVAAFMGCCRQTAARKIRFNKQTGLVTFTDLARQISAG